MPRMTFPRLVVAVTFVGVFAMAAIPAANSDTWWHLETGRVIVETGSLPGTDAFSHTVTGSTWLDHSWLSQVLLHGVHSLASMPGLSLLVAALVAIAFALVWLQMEGSALLRAFVTVLAAAASSLVWSPRPQMISLVLLALVGHLAWRYRSRDVDHLWALPLLFAAWANLHAGWALGMALLGAVIAGSAIDRLAGKEGTLGWRSIGRLALWTVISAGALVLNPSGIDVYVEPFRTVDVGVLRDFVQEWASPDFHRLWAQPFAWMLLATIAAVGWGRRRLDGADLVVVAVFAYAGLLAARNIAPFAVVCAPVLARHAATIDLSFARRRRERADRPVILWALLAAVIALATMRIAVTIGPEAQEAAERDAFPVDAAAWIAANPPAGEMWNPYGWGGYLIWRLWPEQRVYVDGRTDLYGDAFLRDHLAVATARPGFDSILDANDVSWVVDKVGSPLDTALSSDVGWSEVYRDETAVIYVRNG